MSPFSSRRSEGGSGKVQVSQTHLGPRKDDGTNNPETHFQTLVIGSSQHGFMNINPFHLDIQNILNT